LRGGNGLTHSFNRIKIEGPWGRGDWEACAGDSGLWSPEVILLSEPHMVVLAITAASLFRTSRDGSREHNSNNRIQDCYHS
jgi:hypothetical protein